MTYSNPVTIFSFGCFCALDSLGRVDKLLPQALTVNTYGPSNIHAVNTDETFDDVIDVGNDFETRLSREASWPTLVGSRALPQRFAR